MSVSIKRRLIGMGLDCLLALLPQEREEVLNRIFCGPKVNDEILKVMDRHGVLGGAHLLEWGAFPKLGAEGFEIMHGV